MAFDFPRVTSFAQPLNDIDAGTTSGSYTVAVGSCANRILWFADTSAGTCKITLAGGAERTITIPANSGWCGLSFERGEVPAGSTIVFAGVLSNAVFYGRAA